MARLTPMLQQYLSIKQEYPDAVLFFRMGDFYEMFFEDAEIASRILGIALTSRNKGEEDPVPMCGVPHHAAPAYITKLVAQGMKVAVCDQMEDPRTARGIVKREVTRVITPGVQVDTETLDEGVSNYVAGIVHEGRRYGLACLDVSTGDFRVTGLNSAASLLDELARLQPAELVIREGTDLEEETERFEAQTSGLVRNRVPSEDMDLEEASGLLKEQLHLEDLGGTGLDEAPEQVLAAALILRYVRDMQKRDLSHVSEVEVYRIADFMILDESAKRNLELLESLQRKDPKGSLLHVLDRTLTAMGARLLRQWLCYPLIKKEAIRRRLDAVSVLVENVSMRERVRHALKSVRDLERLTGKVALARANARDLNALKESLRAVPAVRDALADSGSLLLEDLFQRLDPLDDVSRRIEATLREDPPLTITEGGMIREGVDPDLDRYLEATRGNRAWVARLESEERKKTGIPSLKVGYNKVFGYYIEVTKPHLSRVPAHYIRKQTLVNAERFVTEELKEREKRILEAQEKRLRLEYDLFVALRREVAEAGARIRAVAAAVAEADVLCALAHVAHHQNYVRPDLNEEGIIRIREGRHPVVEQSLEPGLFVPNDIHMDMERDQILILTGPNMAGKSTVLRQVALITLMAHMGSFVPASEADIGITDRIFTRIGASDDLYRGHSTFMVEMIETARIVHQSTPKSLLILDEIGRGTGTLDGLSIAWAVVEYLHNRRGKGVKTLFATHYHELTAIAQELPRVRNYNIAVKEWKGRILFLRKMVRGGTSHSFGLEVARLAGLPPSIIDRGKEILRRLEQKDTEALPLDAGSGESERERPAEARQLSLFGKEEALLRERLEQVDPDALSPRAALELIYELKGLMAAKKPDPEET